MEDGYWEKRFQGARRIENAPVGDGSELRQRVSASIGGY
jgi:hypothetical protein